MVDSSRRITRIVVLILTVIFLGIFAFTLADYYVRGPSPGFSRERVLAVVPESEARPGDRPIAVLQHPGGQTATVAFVGDGGFRLIEVDATGAVRDDRTYDAGIASADYLGGYRNDRGKPVLFAGTDRLERFEIDAAEGVNRTLISGEIREFESSGPYAVMLGPEGLRVRDDRIRMTTGPVITGRVTGFAVYSDRTGLSVAAVTENDDGSYDVRLVRIDDTGTVTEDRLLMEECSDDRFRKLEALGIEGGTFSLLFLVRDNRYGRNELTLLTWNDASDEPVAESRARLPIVNGRYGFVGRNGDARTVLMRYETPYGPNLAACTMAPGRDPGIRPLTKTRGVSLSATLFRLNSRECLVFADRDEDGLLVSFASDHPDLVKATMRHREADWGMVLGTTVVHGLLAFFACWIVLLVAASPPMILIAAIQRFLRPRMRDFVLLTGAGVPIYTLLKFFVTRYFLESTAATPFPVPVLGSGPALYAALGILSLVSWGLILPGIPAAVRDRTEISGVFLRFAITDGILYSTMFLIYGITAMLLRNM